MNPTMNNNAGSGSILVNEANLPSGIIFKHMHLVSNISYWHKFIVRNYGNTPRNLVLKTILDHVHPYDLIPVTYKIEKDEATFLARNCGTAIQKLCNDNLVIPNPSNPDLPLKLSILLKYATTTEFKVDVQKNVNSVLGKRYDSTKKVLDLTKFHDDPDLVEFCPLSQPKLMYFVLHLSKDLNPKPETYLLGSNRIKLLNPLEALCKNPNLLNLDLRDNLIDDMKSLVFLKSFKLHELVLDGNPLCAKYDYASYIQEIKNYCKTLQKLDGIEIGMGTVPSFRKNYLCDIEGADFVNDFLERFFTIYDSKNRKLLKDLYAEKGLFSLNTSYLNGQVTSHSSDLRKYNNITRNLKKIADMSRHEDYLFKGNFQIINVLHSLPFTEHDPLSFNVDLIHFTNRCAIIVVSGVFRELAENMLESDRYYGFTRTFALNSVHNDGETHVYNDMLHIYNALTHQVSNSFRITKPASTALGLPKTEEEYNHAIVCLKRITNLNTNWSKKCLEECGFNLKKALSLFVNLYKLDKIPAEAFT